MLTEPQPAAATTGSSFSGGRRAPYDSVSILLHWLTAALVLVQFGLSQAWGFFEKPIRHDLVVSHMSFGILLSAVIVSRLVWRLTPGHQVTAAETGWTEVASKTVHFSLYVLLFSQAVLGFMLRWSGGEAMSFFGLQIPPPFAPFSKDTHHSIGDAHNWIGWSIIIIAAGHAAVALFHQYVLRDGLLARMVPAARKA